MEPTALFEKIRHTDNDDEGAALPAWTELKEEKRALIAPVLERMALIQSLKRDSNAAGTDDEDSHRFTALDINLLITCLEMLVSEPEVKERYVETPEPAVEHPEPVLPEIDSMHGAALDVSGGQPAADPVAVAGLQEDVSADLMLEVQQGEAKTQAEQAVMKKPVATAENEPKPVISMHEENSLRRLFTNILDLETQLWIATHCWIYKDDPLEDWDALHLVTVGYNESITAGHVRLTDARKHWNMLTQRQRLEEIADMCQSLRREYTKGNLFRFATGTIDPMPEVLRQAGAAAVDNHISYLSDTAYQRLEHSDHYLTVVLESNETKLKDGELYVRNSAISREGGSEWLEPFLNLAIINSQHGETVIQDHLNRGLVVPDKKFVEHLENWLMAALRKVAA